jgi:hypothetical protein
VRWLGWYFLTEEEAREVLRLGDQDRFEAWIAGQVWIPRNGAGWRVASTIEGATRIAASPPGSTARPAVWVVEAAG